MARHEISAAKELRKCGFDAFTPYEEITQHQTISRRRGTTRPVTIQRPVFPRYLFARSEKVQPLKVQGVIGVVGDCDGPWSIPEKGEFAELVKVAGSGEPMSVLDLTKLSLNFHGKVGDLFEVTDGLPGAVGRIVSLDGLDSRGMVEAEIIIFGAKRTIPVPHQSVGSIIAERGGPRVAVTA